MRPALVLLPTAYGANGDADLLRDISHREARRSADCSSATVPKEAMHPCLLGKFHRDEDK
jgi:hypothetical protein